MISKSGVFCDTPLLFEAALYRNEKLMSKSCYNSLKTSDILEEMKVEHGCCDILDKMI